MPVGISKGVWLEAVDFFVKVSADDYYFHLAGALAVLQFLAELVPVHLGHSDVRYEQVGAIPADRQERVEAVVECGKLKKPAFRLWEEPFL